MNTHTHTHTRTLGIAANTLSIFGRDAIATRSLLMFPIVFVHTTPVADHDDGGEVVRTIHRRSARYEFAELN
jgi:hypothetical protein